MRVCYVNAFYDQSIQTGTELVERYFTVRELAREQAKLGSDVHVLQLFHRDEYVYWDGVPYELIRPSRIATLAASAARAVRRTTPKAHFESAASLARRIDELRPDIIHFFGLTLDLKLWIVSRTATKLGVPIVVQHNGGLPPDSSARRFIQKRNFQRVDCFLFTTMEHTRPWVAEGYPLDDSKVVPLMETSSFFQMQSREEARSQTGIAGDPVFLWTGRLHPEKDPMTALRGFERIAEHWPDAQLCMYYLTDDMLPELRSFVQQSPKLMSAVHFRGRVEHRQLEAIYNSADFFIQASTRETSGLAVLEAMSCGVIPVVSDIPSFRAMTENGRYGVLFPPGDHKALTSGILSICREEIPRLAREVRCRFEDALSFPSLARELNRLYLDIISGRSVSAR